MWGDRRALKQSAKLVLGPTSNSNISGTDALGDINSHGAAVYRCSVQVTGWAVVNASISGANGHSMNKLNKILYTNTLL